MPAAKEKKAIASAPSNPEPEIKKARPAAGVAKHVLNLMKNKLIASLMLFGQGILFLVSPSGNMEGTIRISASIVIAACLAFLLIHLLQKNRSKSDIAIAILNGLIILPAAFCLISPTTVEPYVKIVVGGMTVLLSLVNLFETMKIKKKKDWKFVVSVLGAVAMIGLGIVTILADEAGIALTQRIIGVFLVLNALANLWYLAQLHQEKKRMEAQLKAAA